MRKLELIAKLLKRFISADNMIKRVIIHKILKKLKLTILVNRIIIITHTTLFIMSILDN